MLRDLAVRNRCRPTPAFSASTFSGTRRSAVRPFRCRPPWHRRKGRLWRRRRSGRLHNEHMTPWPFSRRISPCRAPASWSCRGCTWTRPRRVRDIRSENIFQQRPIPGACARCGPWPTAGATPPVCPRRQGRPPCRHGISPWPPPGASRRSHGSFSGRGPAGADRTCGRPPPRPVGRPAGDSAAVPIPSPSPDTAGACPRPSVSRSAPVPLPFASRRTARRSCGRAPAGLIHTTNIIRQPFSHPSVPGTAPDSCVFQLPDPRTCPVSP